MSRHSFISLACLCGFLLPGYVFRPYRSTTYVYAAYCYRPSSVVQGRSQKFVLGWYKFLLHNTAVRYTSSLTSSAAISAQHNFQGLILGGYIYRYTPVATALAWSVGLSVCWSVTLVSPAKTAELIEMPFGLRTLVDPVNHVLAWVKIPYGKGNSWMKWVSHCKV